MASFGSAKGPQKCGSLRFEVLQMLERKFFAACTSFLHDSIQQKHRAPSAGSIVAHTLPCTTVFCSGTLHFLQDPSLHPWRLHREVGGSRQLSSLKFEN